MNKDLILVQVSCKIIQKQATKKQRLRMKRDKHESIRENEDKKCSD